MMVHTEQYLMLLVGVAVTNTQSLEKDGAMLALKA